MNIRPRGPLADSLAMGKRYVVEGRLPKAVLLLAQTGGNNKTSDQRGLPSDTPVGQTVGSVLVIQSFLNCRHHGCLSMNYGVS